MDTQKDAASKIVFVTLVIVFIGLTPILFSVLNKPRNTENTIPSSGPVFPAAHKLKIDGSYKDTFARNYAKLSPQKYGASVDFYIVTGTSTEIALKINKQFNSAGWAINKDWAFTQLAYSTSEWVKDARLATVFLFSDLDNAGIDGFKKTYGIIDLNLGDTLFVVYIVTPVTK